MQGTCLIEVANKEAFPEHSALALTTSLKNSGAKSVRSVKVSQLYRLVGNLSAEQRQRIADDLLCDPVTQETRDGEKDLLDGAPVKKTGVIIDVWFKSGVTDVVGESVQKGLLDLEISGIREVRTGHRYRVQGLLDTKLAQKIAGDLLANPLIQDITAHVA